MVPSGTVSRARADNYHVVVIPFSAHEHLTVDEFRDDRQTNERVDTFSDRKVFQEQGCAHLIFGGNNRGSRLSFSSSSSMRSTFHLSRCTCHVPRANVKNGMMPTRTIVGVIHGYRRAFWPRGWGAAVVDSPRTRVRRKRLVFRRKKEDRKEDNMMPISQWRVRVIHPGFCYTSANKGFLSYMANQPRIYIHPCGYTRLLDISFDSSIQPSSQTPITQLPQTRQNPVLPKPDSPTQTMRHHYTSPPALWIHSTPATEREKSVASGGLS